MAHNNIDEKEHKQIVIKTIIAILRKEFSDLGLTGNLCTMSEFHTEAETIAQAMQLIDKAARQLAERREVE